MKFTLPRIYPITDTRISGLSHFEQASKLIEGGARIIQLRDKYAPSDEFFESVVRVVAHAKAFAVPVIVNDRVDIALAAGAAGVHLGQDDLGPIDARELLGQEAIIGFSTHSVDQAIAAVNLPVDYIAAGPVFETGSKKDPDPVIGCAGLTAIRQAIGELPLVAIGGITTDRLDLVFASGADSAAIISDLYRDGSDIAESTGRLIQIANSL